MNRIERQLRGVLPPVGTEVRVVRLTSDGEGFMIRRERLALRRAGAEGQYYGPVAGCGGDVWWISHIDTGVIVPYSTDELELAVEPPSRQEETDRTVWELIRNRTIWGGFYTARYVAVRARLTLREAQRSLKRLHDAGKVTRSPALDQRGAYRYRTIGKEYGRRGP